jgi:signal transduction histidine kinase/HAMP domain-containing protein
MTLIRHRGHIGPRLLAIILLFSSAVTLAATFLQLYIDYGRDVGAITSRFDEIEHSYRDTLSASLWNLDRDGLQLQLDGILRLPDMAAVELRAASSAKSSMFVNAGQRGTGHKVVREISIPDPRGTAENLGTLYIEATLGGVYRRLVEQIVVIAAGQGSKAFLVSFFILFVFHTLVTRHLVTVARFAGEYDVRRPSPPLQLSRRPPKTADEFDQLTAAFNGMCSNLERAYGELAEANVLLGRDVIRLAQAIDSSGQAIALYDAESRLVACNRNYLNLHALNAVPPSTEALLGLSYQETLELRLASRLYDIPEGEATKFVERRLAIHRTPGSDEAFRLTDGRWMQVSVHAMPDGGLAHVWADVTGIKTAEAQRRELEFQLHHSQKLEALGTLAGGIAHDLNNTLVPILALSRLMAKRASAGSSDHDSLEVIAKAAVHAKNLVSQILAFSRKEQQELMNFDLAELLRETLSMLASAIPTSITIEDDIAEVPPFIGDKDKIRQIIVNVMMNAAQAIGDRSGTIAISLHSHASEDGVAYTRLTVQDSGCGMDEATRQRIFEPFFTTRAVNQGTGLGLSITHGIVAAHGGTIGVRSAPGRGTVFEIDFPLAPRSMPAAQLIPAPAAA